MITVERRHLREQKGYHRTEVGAESGRQGEIHLRCNVIDLLAFKRECSRVWDSAVGMVVLSFITFNEKKLACIHDRMRPECSYTPGVFPTQALD